MKRHPSLQPLSDDHHTALVLARRLRGSASEGDPGALRALTREVQEILEAELEPHFRIEETWLLPALAAQGADRFVERIARDHARLRELIRHGWSRDTPHQIGTLLEKHVRYEERQVFPATETLLSPAELDAIRNAALRSNLRSKEQRRSSIRADDGQS